MTQLENELKMPALRPKAFALLVKQTQRYLYWHIRKMVLIHEDADDILQNTYMKAWNALGEFRFDSKVSTWLYRIATNETLTFLANKRLKNIASPLDLEDEMVNSLIGDSYFNGDEAELKLQRAILSLPEKQRLVFNMKYYQDLTYEEMAEILGNSVGTLKATYFHASKKIEQFVLNQEVDE